jgi:methylmalonyl-CoA/ethylmalonyl-CoA epimerase
VIIGVAHVGVAAGDLDDTANRFEQLLESRVVRSIDTPQQQVRAEFIAVDQTVPEGRSEVEVLSPRAPDTPLGRFLEKNGPGLHHLCFAVDDVAAEVERLTTLGVPLIDVETRHPDVNAPFNAFAWIHPSATGGVLVELIQFPEGDRDR